MCAALLLALLSALPAAAFDVSISGNLAVTGGAVPNWASTITAWSPADFARAPPPGLAARYPFLRYVQLFTATGGCYLGYSACTSTRDLFIDNAVGLPSGVNATPLFAPLRNILAAGLKPHLVTGNVPIALSDPPVLGGFGFNAAPPRDMAEYRTYIALVAAQLAAEFSLAEVATWRWGVFTEYNNQDWLRANASTFAALFDHTACGLVDALGAPAAVDLGVHACTQCGGGAWDPLAFLQHAATGVSACSGGRVHLNWTGNSFYEHAPGAPGDLSWLAPQALPVLEAARALGLPAARFGIDEGRLLWGPEGPAYALTTRAVGPPYQGSWDALMFRRLAATGVPDVYYSRWGLGYAPGAFADPAGNADTVATNVAQLAYALAGLPSVPTTNASTGGSGGSGCASSSIVDGVVALDSSGGGGGGGGGGGWRVAALLFHHHPWLNASDAGSGCSGAAVSVALCGAPARAAGAPVPGATATRVGAAAANAWPVWAAAAAAANLSYAAGDYTPGWSALSDSPPLASARAYAALARAMPALQAASALAREPLAGGAAVGADACLRFQVALAPHEVALVELVLPA